MRTALLLLSACALTPEPGVPAEREFQAIDGMRALAEDAGWTVQEGEFSFQELAFCCEPFVHCGGVDPGATIGTYSLPKAPAQEAPDPDLYWMWGSDPPDDTTRDFRLQPDEAMVWIGRAPPRSDYFAFRTMLSTRDDGSGNRERVAGALGPPLNQQVMIEQRGGESELWGKPLVVITAADFAIEEQVRDWLVAAGIDDSQIHVDRIAAAEVDQGLHTRADTLTTQVHIVGPADPISLVRWTNDPGARVFRMTPGEVVLNEPIGTPMLAPRGTGLDESSLEPALDELTLAIAATWPTHFLAVRPVEWDWHPTFTCMDTLDCQGDVHDRLRSESIDLRLDNNSFAVAMGVNHVQAGKASAMTLAAHRSITGAGVAWLADEDLVGSARAWLGDTHPHADDLYAVILSRDCDAFLGPCLEVPSLCPGPAPGEDLYLSWGTYLEPSTGAAPLPDELLIDRVLKFVPLDTP